jgi:hypothetical protein
MRKSVANGIVGPLLVLSQVVIAVILSGCAATTQSPAAVKPPTPSQAATSSTWGLNGSAEAVAQAHGLRIIRLVKSREDTLPTSFDDSEWGPIQGTLLGEGYDLRPYTGRGYRFSRYRIADKSGRPMSQEFRYLESDGRCIGAYLHDSEAIPGPQQLP